MNRHILQPVIKKINLTVLREWSNKNSSNKTSHTIKSKISQQDSSDQGLDVYCKWTERIVPHSLIYAYQKCPNLAYKNLYRCYSAYNDKDLYNFYIINSRLRKYYDE